MWNAYWSNSFFVRFEEILFCLFTKSGIFLIFHVILYNLRIHTCFLSSQHNCRSKEQRVLKRDEIVERNSENLRKLLHWSFLRVNMLVSLEYYSTLEMVCISRLVAWTCVWTKGITTTKTNKYNSIINSAISETRQTKIFVVNRPRQAYSLISKATCHRLIQSVIRPHWQHNQSYGLMYSCVSLHLCVRAYVWACTAFLFSHRFGVNNSTVTVCSFRLVCLQSTVLMTYIHIMEFVVVANW